MVTGARRCLHLSEGACCLPFVFVYEEACPELVFLRDPGPQL